MREAAGTGSQLRRLLPAAGVLCCGYLLLCTGLLQAAEPAVSLSERIQQHVEAGEFAAARKLIDQAPAAERSELLSRVASVQFAAGETSAARSTVRRIPQAAPRAMAPAGGGGNFANPYPVMMMIMQLTGGLEDDPPAPWFQIDGEGGDISWSANGVIVNPEGVLSRISTTEQAHRLSDVGVKARQGNLNAEMAKSSPLRFVSLARLEQAVASRIEEGQPVLKSMQHLAGLTRVQYIILVPEENDVLLAGPAEGWKYNSEGLAVGVESGWPMQRLGCLVTVLRTFQPGGQGIFGCSINPRPENLKATQEFVNSSYKYGPLDNAAMSRFFTGIRQRMGLQDIQVYGVPLDSQVARTIISADYRMKLIGIGKLEGGPSIPSVFELLPKFAGQQPKSLDALRWWLTMKYDAILHNPDHTVFEITGSSVQVLSEDQLIGPNGERVHTGKASPVNRTFAENFTNGYAELAKRDAAFADLQNLFDLAMVAGVIRAERLTERGHWDLGAFASDGAYVPRKVPAARTVESVLNYRIYKGQDIVVQVAGGVRGDVLSIARDEKLQQESTELTGLTKRAEHAPLPAGRWWWDAAE